MVGLMLTYGILREDTRNARVVERIEKLCTYRSYEMDPRNNLVQYIKHLERMSLEVMHLR